MHDVPFRSWFSGVGGLDMGLERAGFRAISHSEIDPYASAVLEERWPGVPNLGCIHVAGGAPEHEHRGYECVGLHLGGGEPTPGRLRPDAGEPVAGDKPPHAASRALGYDEPLWAGGPPCQDFSVAGKRKGLAGERSGLALTWFELVGRYRPRAVLFENVPGLLSSHAGRDMAAVLGALVDLGYGVAFRTLDARHFGVPQRRRRIFILGLRSEADDPTGRVAAERAAQVLAVGTRCRRHPAAGGEAGSGPADGARDCADIAGTFTAGAHPGSYNGQDAYTGHLVAGAIGRRPYGDRGDGDLGELVGAIAPGAKGWRGLRGDGSDPVVIGEAPDSGGVRAADGLARRPHDRDDLAGPILSTGQGGQRTTDLNTPLVVGTFALRGREEGNVPEVSADGLVPSLRGPGGGSSHAHVFTKAGRAQTADDGETWREGDVMPTLNAFDVGDVRTTAAIVGTDVDEDALLPLGLDSHRYRCCGNGVVSSVSEWIGHRLYAELVS